MSEDVFLGRVAKTMWRNLSRNAMCANATSTQTRPYTFWCLYCRARSRILFFYAPRAAARRALPARAASSATAARAAPKTNMGRGAGNAKRPAAEPPWRAVMRDAKAKHRPRLADWGRDGFATSRRADFEALSIQFPNLFFPAFRMQDSMRKAFFGVKWWERKLRRYDDVKRSVRTAGQSTDKQAAKEAKKEQQRHERATRRRGI